MREVLTQRSSRGRSLNLPLSDQSSEKFREKFDTGDVKKYYSKLDVGLVVDLEFT
jgi:hypothetical protein